LVEKDDTPNKTAPTDDVQVEDKPPKEEVPEDEPLPENMGKCKLPCQACIQGHNGINHHF